jgi:hypothetical protein
MAFAPPPDAVNLLDNQKRGLPELKKFQPLKIINPKVRPIRIEAPSFFLPKNNRIILSIPRKAVASCLVIEEIADRIKITKRPFFDTFLSINNNIIPVTSRSERFSGILNPEKTIGSGQNTSIIAL